MDTDLIRAQTPGTRHAVHLNAAGSALAAAPVLAEVVAHLTLESEIGGYEAADAAAGRLAASYGTLAELVGAAPGEIAFTESATRAWDQAFYAIPFKPGDRILTTTSEYSSNALAYAQAARRHGTVTEVVPDDADGTIDLTALEESLGRGGVRLVALNHVPTHDGLINPAAEVGALARAHGALFLLDACQSVGQLPVDVSALGVDLLSATGRKFLRGPRGTGFLYVRGGVLDQLEPAVVDLCAADLTGPSSFTFRPDARRFESWERSVAGQLGLAAAARYALDLGLDAIAERVQGLAARLRAGLADVPGITVHDRGRHKSGIVTFGHTSAPAATIVQGLAARGVVTRVSEQTYRYDDGPTPAARVRASVHYYNTEDEIDTAVTTLAALLRTLA
ncbi:aminotransferase class V-fold PLP-dependent enzyme [Actinocorallia sp. API 0066]|uniref:aminotransferase class V-fold PLP-dependent enzyme n=1 Tax=Actinocorallia sp. API 0066 TaxID=2896846 RepID=UPI001E53CF08|nr:aminotransferase class V-fold PLP-dependent enzyme [Actinocorallia sp. API 0066]MCD0450588.1 aminotransferase class V-fold PLP-dependent enzyme [Actinocorallia sp. API 0066]